MSAQEYMKRRLCEITLNLLGIRIDLGLSRLLPEYSRTQLQDIIQKGGVRVNGRPVRSPSQKIKEVGIVELQESTPQPVAIEAADIELDVVYEDEHILIINKQAGLVCHPAPGHHGDTLVNALLHKFALSDVDPMRPGIVHRLDKDTSGLLLVAKTNRAHFEFAKLFAHEKGKLIRRKYWCVVYGVLTPQQGKIETLIRRHHSDRKKFEVSKDSGKFAVTLYDTKNVCFLHPRKCLSLVECELLTGRTHQIRVHLSSRGCPLVGDRVYGGNRHSRGFPPEIADFPRQALHSFELSFWHPLLKRHMSFQSLLPYDMAQLVATAKVWGDKDFVL